MKHLIFSSFPRFLVTLAFSLIASGVIAPSLHAQDAPTPYPDPKDETAWPGTGPIRVFPWMIQNRTYFWTQRADKQGAVVFVGDSLLGNWTLAKVKTEAAFPKIKVLANRAIGGDVSRGVLFRFQEDVLDLHPEAIVMLIGTNDLSARGPIDGIISNIKAILDVAQKANPATPIVLLKLPPRNNPQALIDNSQVTLLNDAIAKLAEGRDKVTVFDTFTLFAKPDGTPDPANYKPDQLHPSDSGYEKLSQALTPVFDQLQLH